MNCYKRFASIYDKLIYGDVDYKKWASNIIEICDNYNIMKENYLDLACGTGNMTEKMSALFKNTWAVDISSEMLTRADEKLRNQGKKANFVCQDITKLNLNKKFDLVTCILDSANYILEDEKLERYFNNIYNHLKDNGLFIFDMNSYYKLTKILGDNIFTYDDEDVVYIWENELEKEVINMYLTFFVKESEKDETYIRFDEEHRERAYKTEFVTSLLHNTGFKILKIMDGYENKEVDEYTQRIVYVVAKK